MANVKPSCDLCGNALVVAYGLFVRATKKHFGSYCCFECAEKDCWGPIFKHGRTIRRVKLESSA